MTARKKRTPFKYGFDFLCQSRVPRRRALTKAVREHGFEHVFEKVAKAREKNMGSGVPGFWPKINDDWMYLFQRHAPKSSRNKTCPSGQLAVRRKGYTRADGTRVKGTTYCATDTGAPGRGEKKIPTPHPGALGGPGYTTKSAAERHRLIRALYKKAGYAKTIAALQSRANLTHRTSPTAAKVFETDVRWAQKNLEGTRNMSLNWKEPARKTNVAVEYFGGVKHTSPLRATAKIKEGTFQIVGEIDAKGKPTGYYVLRWKPKGRKNFSILNAGFNLLPIKDKAQEWADFTETEMYKKRKLSRNKGKTMAKRNAKKKTKKKAKKRTTSRPKGFGSSRQRSTVGLSAPGAWARRSKKKATKKRSKKKTAKRKTSKKKTAKRKTQGKCLTQAQAKQMRKQLAALQKTLSSMKTKGAPKAKSAKAKAAAQLRKLRAAYITAAACRLGVQRAKSAGQKVTAKCKKPPSRVGKSAKVLGRQRAQKSGEKRYTTKQLMRNFMNPKEPLIK